MKPKLTYARLVEVLNYDEITGIFTWKKSTSKRPVEGRVAGHEHGQGYLAIGIDGRVHGSHRLAWMYVNGALPQGQVDHRDGCRSHNAISNLRAATNYENQQNQRSRPGGSALGTHKHKKYESWKASIGVAGKQIYLGSFKTEAEASAAYLAAKVKHHPFQTLVKEES